MYGTTKLSVPKDVTALCEDIARGYERRKKDYENKRIDIIYSHSSGFEGAVGGSRSAGNTSDPSAAKAERLMRLEKSLDAQFLKAVEQSLMMLGTDISRDSRERLRKAVILNCENGREYPFEYLGIDEFSRREFYRRRKSFIIGIGAILGLIDND
ncbi:MAG: hypothetical protein FWF94_02055 [Oscillospiraceae bacterium]|nr:hypothetical protein [Oscillospiraceae bacterium]